MIPSAPVTNAVPNPTFPGAVLVTVRCPYRCRAKTHTHGIPAGDTGPNYGHRVSHCTDDNEGYRILDVDGLVP